MTQPLHHLVYQSEATYFLNESEMQRVLVQSRAWNAAHGITGVLLHCGGDIMQVLEGSREEVQFIFQRIAHDVRHIRLVKLADGPIAQRQFEQWAMGFKPLNPAAFNRLQGLVEPLRALPPASAGHDRSLREMLANFVSQEAVRP